MDHDGDILRALDANRRDFGENPARSPVDTAGQWAAFLRECGFGDVSLDRISPQTINAVGAIRGDGSKRPLLLCGRLDAGTERRVLVSMARAARAVADSGFSRSRDIFVVGCSGREGISKLPDSIDPLPEIAITAGDGLGTSRPSALHVVLSIRGKPAWIGNRHMLSNIHAIEKAAAAVEAIDKGGVAGEGACPAPRVSVQGIIGGLTEDHVVWRPAMVPDHCSMVLKVELAPDLTASQAIGWIRAALDRQAEADSDLSYFLDLEPGEAHAFANLVPLAPAYLVDEDHPLVVACHRRDAQFSSPDEDVVPVVAATQDAALLGAAGITAISYGAPEPRAAKVLALTIADMVT